jgi:septal ring factor EnvC (AmiA/AmiB activator)
MVARCTRRAVAVAVLAAGLAPSPEGGAWGAADPAGERLRGMEAEIERLGRELRELAGRESGVLGELERLGAELRLRGAEREAVGLRHEQVTESIRRQTGRLAALERSQRARADYLGFRLREIYKSGPDGPLRRIVGDGGVEAYWEGVRYASYLSERDARVLEAFRLDARRIGERRAELEEERALLERTEAELAQAAERLERARGRRRASLEIIRSDRSKRRQAMDELQSAAQELGRVVEGLAGDAPLPELDIAKFRGLLDWPADGGVSAGFGTVVHPRFKTRVPHPGLDIAAELGARIRSVFDGRVVFSDWMRGYGLTAIVDHGGGVLSIYAHASALLVEPGEAVARGQLLGLVGDTGSLSGAYLYFELREDGAPTDPVDWLRPR